MSYTYAERKKTAGAKPDAAQTASPQRMEALQSGAAKPTAAEMGHRVDLPEAMRARMESSFGADLSSVRLYESKAVGDAGAEAITQGSNIAFAPGKLDLTSSGGQALLGHELSHVVSQQRGEVTGSGFLNDSALEERADREGAMAARGESVYGGAAAPMSAASAAPAAGPMQASRDKYSQDAFSKNPWKRYKQMKGKMNQMQHDEAVQMRVLQEDRKKAMKEKDYESAFI